MASGKRGAAVSSSVGAAKHTRTAGKPDFFFGWLFKLSGCRNFCYVPFRFFAPPFQRSLPCSYLTPQNIVYPKQRAGKSKNSIPLGCASLLSAYLVPFHFSPCPPFCFPCKKTTLHGKNRTSPAIDHSCLKNGFLDLFLRYHAGFKLQGLKSLAIVPRKKGLCKVSNYAYRLSRSSPAGFVKNLHTCAGFG